MKTVNQLVAEIKENNQDYEFYPTTQEIVNALVAYCGKKAFATVLDIGCGNGAFFQKLDVAVDDFRPKKYGIEKSFILAAQLPEDVILLGTDFNEQTLIDKSVNMIFCNPPYSEYEAWAEKIILQGNCKMIALVIPTRWRGNECIKYALEKRKAETKIIGTYDFTDAERKARATVDLLLITGKEKSYYESKMTDPFDLWFDDTFKISAEKEKSYESESAKKDEIENELVQSGDTAETLVELYNRDMEKLYGNYRKLEELDAELLKELQVDIPKLKESLKSRLKGLKWVYWDLLFKRYDRITSRLTSAVKRRIVNRLNDNTAIDFTYNNIYQLTQWVIKNSNVLFEEQITEYFYSLCNTENIHRYKSNKRWSDDDWRYLKDGICEYGRTCYEKVRKMKNIMLDYRIVVTSWRNFGDDWGGRFEMVEHCIDFLSDTLIVARNLGFDAHLDIPTKYDRIDPDDWKNFNILDAHGGVFANVKLYKNGNRHIKFCKEFMRKLNVEMGRINGWVRDKSEAMREMDIPSEEINDVWGSNLQIGISEGRTLLGLPEHTSLEEDR